MWDAMNRGFSRKELLGTGGLTALATVLCICAHWEPRFPGDLRLTLLIQSVESRPLDFIMEWVTHLTAGWPAAVLIVIAGITVWRCLGKLEAGLVLMTGLGFPIYSALKLAVNRPRPTSDLVRVFEVEAGKSFPSGHAFFAIVFWGLLAYFVFTYLQKRGLRAMTLSGLLMIILLIGASRVYLGAHWPSDVLGGYVVGGVFLTILVWLDRKWQPRPESSSPEKNGGNPRSEPS
jgi:membrane-associated phospholipid phosphatase